MYVFSSNFCVQLSHHFTEDCWLDPLVVDINILLSLSLFSLETSKWTIDIFLAFLVLPNFLNQWLVFWNYLGLFVDVGIQESLHRFRGLPIEFRVSGKPSRAFVAVLLFFMRDVCWFHSLRWCLFHFPTFLFAFEFVFPKVLSLLFAVFVIESFLFDFRSFCLFYCSYLLYPLCLQQIYFLLAPFSFHFMNC